MSPPPPSPLAANAVVPTNGGLYVVEAIGYNHWLNLAYSGTFDGEVILAYGPDTSDPTPATNMVWQFLTYPTTDGSTVFTLQALSTMNSLPTEFNGRGGYVRVDSTTNKLVQGAEPFSWQLIEVAPGVYKMSPFDEYFNFGGTVVVTDPQEVIEPSSNPYANQANLQLDNNSLQQFWTFNTISSP